MAMDGRAAQESTAPAADSACEKGQEKPPTILHAVLLPPSLENPLLPNVLHNKQNPPHSRHNIPTTTNHIPTKPRIQLLKRNPRRDDLEHGKKGKGKEGGSSIEASAKEAKTERKQRAISLEADLLGKDEISKQNTKAKREKHNKTQSHHIASRVGLSTNLLSACSLRIPLAEGHS